MKKIVIKKGKKLSNLFKKIREIDRLLYPKSIRKVIYFKYLDVLLEPSPLEFVLNTHPEAQEGFKKRWNLKDKIRKNEEKIRKIVNPNPSKYPLNYSYRGFLKRNDNVNISELIRFSPLMMEKIKDIEYAYKLQSTLGSSRYKHKEFPSELDYEGRDRSIARQIADIRERVLGDIKGEDYTTFFCCPSSGISEEVVTDLSSLGFISNES